jgi:hypothetical protein
MGATSVMPSHQRKDENYSPEETERRMTDAIRRALNTPPKPQKELVGKGKRVSAKLKEKKRRPV